LFKKILAAAATLMVAAGISVIAVAAPASAHHTSITPSAVCTTDGGWDVKWTVSNSQPETATVTVSNNDAVKKGDLIPASGAVFTQHVMTNAPVSLAISVVWPNKTTYSDSATFKTFPAGCGTTLVKPVDPDVKTVNACGVEGSVKPVSTPGVDYTIVKSDKATGDWEVLATPQKNYVFEGGAKSKTFTGNYGVFYACDSKPTVSLADGKCVYQPDGTGARDQVKITFDNNKSNTPVEFVIVGYPKYTKTVGANNQVEVILDKADAGLSSYTVTAGGKSFTITVPECPPVTKPNPIVRNITSDKFDCASEVVNVTTTTFTTDYVFNTTTKVWDKQAEVAGTPVLTTRPLTPAEKTKECGVEIKTEPTASACATGTDTNTAFTRWIKVTPDARITFSAKNTATNAVTPLTSAYTEVAAGKYIVTAVGATGYELKPATSQTWTLFVEDTAKCEPPTLPIVTPTYSSTPLTCTTSGTYTLGAVDPGTVTWQVNGVATPAGTYTVVTAQKLTLTAAPTKTTDGLDPAWTNPTVLTFSAPSTTCDLETLALTGQSQGNILTLAGGMVLLGLGGLLIARRRWVATNTK